MPEYQKQNYQIPVSSLIFHGIWLNLPDSTLFRTFSSAVVRECSIGRLRKPPTRISRCLRNIFSTPYPCLRQGLFFTVFRIYGHTCKLPLVGGEFRLVFCACKIVTCRYTPVVRNTAGNKRSEMHAPKRVQFSSRAASCAASCCVQRTAQRSQGENRGPRWSIRRVFASRPRSHLFVLSALKWVHSSPACCRATARARRLRSYSDNRAVRR